MKEYHLILLNDEYKKHAKEYIPYIKELIREECKYSTEQMKILLKSTDIYKNTVINTLKEVFEVEKIGNIYSIKNKITTNKINFYFNDYMIYVTESKNDYNLYYFLSRNLLSFDILE